MSENLTRLKARLADVNDLTRANAVLGWDQQTYMPSGGAAARGEQMATLSRLAHELFIAPETGELLERAADEVANHRDDDNDVYLVRVASRDYKKSARVPTKLVAEMRRHGARANSVWIAARKTNDFASFAPYLQRTVELCRDLAENLGYEDCLYDALLNEFEPGMKTAQVRTIFDNLKKDLVPLVQAIAERVDRVSDAVVHQSFEEDKQEAFGRMVAERFGYDFSRGRQDRAVHPFETTFSTNDVRITTRFESEFLNPALFGTMHETGHALYEQGIDPALEGTLLARGTSLGLHESQSRMWENVVGRSRSFWQHFYPALQATFPGQLASVELDTFYGAINKVQPSLVRVEADEVTYNLHIMLRFEMEVDLLEGAYSVAEAPEMWNNKMEEYLGVRPPDDSEGILQDIHWTTMMGYFPTYSLGNILSMQLFNCAVRDVPEIPGQIAEGEFDSLRGWMREHVYQYGRKYEPNELIQRATGETIQSRAYVAYLENKYKEIYGL